MANKYISALITKYFNNNLPLDIQSEFHKWFINSGSSLEKKEVMFELWENCPSQKNSLTEKELKRVHLRIHNWEKSTKSSLYLQIIRAACILLLPVLGFLSGLFLNEGKAPVVMEADLIECFVPYGERKQILLSDGSKVWLNAGSMLIYEKDFIGNTRSMFLSGEANFTVAHNPDKPFIVKTMYMDVEALGTVFNVQSYQEDENCITTLESGKVKINTKQLDGDPIILTPNEQLIYNRVSGTYVTQKVRSEKASQWKQGFLVFQSSSFDDMVTILERRFGIKINYDQRQFKGRSFTVKFSPEEDLNRVLDVLQGIVKMKYKIENGTVYIM